MAKVGINTPKLKVENKVLIKGVDKVAETKRGPKIDETEPQPFHRKSGEGGGKVKKGQNTRGFRAGNSPRRKRTRGGIEGKNVATVVPTRNKTTLDLGNSFLKTGSNRLSGIFASELIIGFFLPIGRVFSGRLTAPKEQNSSGFLG